MREWGVDTLRPSGDGLILCVLGASHVLSVGDGLCVQDDWKQKQQRIVVDVTVRKITFDLLLNLRVRVLVV